MCGIIGYTGKEPAAPILVDGLKRLEYRGYDSAGIAVVHDGSLSVEKKKGHVAELEKAMAQRGDMEGFTGIGHTRWATHGKPSDLNSHPHLSSSGRIAVVHNGIIENYASIKSELLAEGVTFRSETDTEVVAQLIDRYYESDLAAAIRKTLDRLEGSYALGIVAADRPDVVFAARKDSPLVIGVGKKGNFIASDVAALLKYTRNIYRLNDYELAEVHPNRVIVTDRKGAHINKELETVDWDMDSAEKGGYEHFMLKEIHEQPAAFSTLLARRLHGETLDFSDFKTLTPDSLKEINRVYFVACGTAYYVGVAGRYVYEKLLRVPCEACLASEFRYYDPVVDEKTLVIVVSQSGTTEDTIKALREAKARGAKTLGIVNVVGSTVSDLADDVIYTLAGPEIAVASTKAYTTQLTAMYLFGIYLAQLRQSADPEFLRTILTDLRTIPAKMNRVLESEKTIQEMSSRYCSRNDVYFIGRHMDYAVALEGSLKFKEISYIHSEAYAAGELKHGPISLIEEGTPVIALATVERLFDKLMSNAQEVITRGASVIVVTTENNCDRVKGASEILTIPEIQELLSPLLSVLPMQLLAYYVAYQRGCNIDKPRNLAKSVTVE